MHVLFFRFRDKTREEVIKTRCKIFRRNVLKTRVRKEKRYNLIKARFVGSKPPFFFIIFMMICIHVTYSYLSTTNIHLFDAKEHLKKYNSVDDIIDEFYHERLNLYKIRKDYQLEKLRKEIEILSNIVLGLVGE